MLCAAWAGCGGASLNRPAAYVTQPGEAHNLLTLTAATAFPSIVGLWTVQLYDKDNNQIDYGYMAWHDDGTEFMQSVSRAPSGGWNATGCGWSTPIRCPIRTASRPSRGCARGYGAGSGSSPPGASSGTR